MSLADFTTIGIEIFAPYVIFWALVFVTVCILLAIFVGLIRMIMSRI